MIEVRGVSKRYGKTQAVSDLSFEVRPGEIVGLVGPNGAGKTTTLRAIVGILRPDSGEVIVAGHDVRRRPLEAKRALAYVPDEPHPFELLTVLEHLRFTALAYRVEDPEPRIEALLHELRLFEKRDAFGSTLSRGMRQKLAFACAFLHDPRAILLDEPLTGLDPRAIRDVRESIVARARAGAAVLLSSHLLDLVERICDRVLVLRGGRRLVLGTMDDIRAYAAERGGGDLESLFLAITSDDAPAAGATGASDSAGAPPR